LGGWREAHNALSCKNALSVAFDIAHPNSGSIHHRFKPKNVRIDGELTELSILFLTVGREAHNALSCKNAWSVAFDIAYPNSGNIHYRLKPKNVGKGGELTELSILFLTVGREAHNALSCKNALSVAFDIAHPNSGSIHHRFKPKDVKIGGELTKLSILFLTVGRETHNALSCKNAWSVAFDIAYPNSGNIHYRLKPKNVGKGGELTELSILFLTVGREAHNALSCKNALSLAFDIAHPNSGSIHHRFKPKDVKIGGELTKLSILFLTVGRETHNALSCKNAWSVAFDIAYPNSGNIHYRLKPKNVGKGGELTELSILFLTVGREARNALSCKNAWSVAFEIAYPNSGNIHHRLKPKNVRIDGELTDYLSCSSQ
jgi:hypothetical protein